jgi:hypothetical protein
VSGRVHGQEGGLEHVQEVEVEGLQLVGVRALLEVVDVLEEDDEAAVEAVAGDLRDAAAGDLHAEQLVVVVIIVILQPHKIHLQV